VIVGAINVGTGEMEYFDRDRPEGLSFEHVAASGSLPPSFPMTPIEDNSYWDGGLFSNTPLSPAINALEASAGGDRAVVRELIVVELFPMKAAVPRTFAQVLQRMVQLQYTSRLTLDADLVAKFGRIIDLVEQVERELPDTSTVRTDPLFTKLRAHRRIDHLSVITSNLPPDLSNASDFSRMSIEARIQAGYDDAIAQGIGDVGAPGLGRGVRSPAAEPATASA
jgi:predicted acylesterase/phospholipase RssA